MAPRTVADATRFTPTGPHAFTPGAPHMPSETPGERVQRLREQAKKDKAARQAGSGWERVIDKGRRIADVAHRVTATALIASTGTSSAPASIAPLIADGGAFWDD